MQPSMTAELSDESYVVFENLIRDRVSSHEGPLFTTSATPDALWTAYIQNLPEGRRNHYECNACRRFIQTYGGIVKIEADGTIRSLLWQGQGDEEVPPFFGASVRGLTDLIARSKVTGVFLTSSITWGTPSTPDKKRGCNWSHLSARHPEARNGRIVGFGALTADQRAAEKLEDYKMLVHALADYKVPEVEQTLRVLRSESVARSEKALGIAEWFAKRQGEDANQRWLAVATAPPGFCHVRSTMISTLLDDVKEGLDFTSIARRWGEKMNPLQYQRPTASPKEGAIDAAEKIVEKLGVARSLERRFAELSDVQVKIWEPRTPRENQQVDGVFGHLRGQRDAVREVVLPATKITWEKFARTVLSDARQMEIYVPSHGNFYALVTAAHDDAPPILQWDGLEGHPRNAVSSYVYANGSDASRWGLLPGWGDVSAVFGPPHSWQAPEKFKHHSKSIFFSIKGSHDQDDQGRGLAIFPEILRSEFHGIRHVIEAHSKKGGISGKGSANGLAFGSRSGDVTVRVDGSDTYCIDRMD